MSTAYLPKEEQLYVDGRAKRGKSAGDIRLPAQFVYSKCIARKCLTLKMKVKVIEYTIRNSSWQIINLYKTIL